MPEDFDYQPSYMQYPIVDEYFRHCFNERKQRLGDKARIMPFTGNLFPNTSYHGRQPRGIAFGIRTAQPKPKPGAFSWSMPTRRPK